MIVIGADTHNGLDRAVWLDRIGGRLRRSPQTARVRIARDLVSHVRAATRRIHELEREIAALVEKLCPPLLAEPGCGPLTTAKLVGEIAGADRYSSDAKLARAAGVALRCLKRHLARRVRHLLTDPTHDPVRAPQPALTLT